MQTDATPAERRSQGKASRKTAPRSSHAQWTPSETRLDPVALLSGQDADRLQWLVPIRHGRMAVSPLTFYRGAAGIMAADLAGTPTSGLDVQLCGDAHLSNFGSYASPSREQVFDVNDFDETLPGPWEWDVKRLAASFVVAGRDRGFDEKDIHAATMKSVAVYRQAMASFAAAGTLDLWYSRLTLDRIGAALPEPAQKRFVKGQKKAHSKDSLRALSKLAEQAEGGYRIKSDPPLLVPLRELSTGKDPEALREEVDSSFAAYTHTMNDDRKRLLQRFHIVDVALKVVGVGSVGTRCLVVLLQGKDSGDPLFLQVKEAGDSVLAEYLPKSTYARCGQRVVEGQRLMQAASDIFLGWSEAKSGIHFYWRQLHDMKGSADIDTMDPQHLTTYAGLCGWTLAHAHARAGDAIAISGYLGSSETFDSALTEFAHLYADQNERDYKAFTAAIDSGVIAAKSD
ncbi:MAG TPA: DUF2252 domain-containing protein [Thermoleophilia bacterium]|nr:DUF2252 domain-containing protein [Thermoleophilia bacterium]